MAEFQQTTLPGIAEKEGGPHVIPTKAGGKLTAQRIAFVAEYLTTYDGTAAAIKAGYSVKSAARMANKLVHNGPVAELIKREEEKALIKAGISKVRALIELARLAYSNPRNLFREDNTLKDPNEWDDDTAATVASVEVFEEFEGSGNNRRRIGETKKVKQWNKNEALRNLLQHLGLLVEKKEITGAEGKALFDFSKVNDEELSRQAAELQRLMGRVGALDDPLGQ